MLQKTDILFAHKALNIAADLSACDRRVAGAIIDHFNKRTGQCDPGIERLSTLLGIDARTVKRATADLCGKHGLFQKVSHGGKSHRASYTPNWEKFAAIVADWDARMIGKTKPPEAGGNGAELPPSMGRNCPVKGGETAPQTLRRNLSNKPIAPHGASGEAVSSPQPMQPEPRPSSQPMCRNGLSNGSVQHRSAKRFEQPQVARSVSHSEAAQARAEQRLDADLRALGWHAYSQAIEQMTNELTQEATAAEVAHKGGGVRLVMDRLGLDLLRSAAAIGGPN